ncbi:hypothetical protein C2S51_028031 [Perilla frutescens var. frutescens]|nr:hypothetical protein C2S51_028031 [Perilla frutescens var. frutescens]
MCYRVSGEGPSGGGELECRNSFLKKKYQMVDDSSMDDLISWNKDGTTLIMWQSFKFAQYILPKYFKPNNFPNFVRQLNLYGFQKVGHNRWEFAKHYIRRGEKEMLKEIQRRKGTADSNTVATATTVAVANAQAVPVTIGIQISSATSGDGQVLSSNLSPAASVASATMPPSLHSCSSFWEENDILRRENSQLSQELNHLRRENSQPSQEVNRLMSLYNNIYNLMSGYLSNVGLPN